MIALDLFSGCGGLTQGLKYAGFQVAAAVELDPLAVETYRRNHPEVDVINNDINTISPHLLMQRLGLQAGELDLLAGCPPCQGFSSMRTLNRGRAVADARNDLIHAFVRFVIAFRPRVVMMENVPGLATDKRFRRICSKLTNLGYHCTHKVCNTADYGVPQRRRRLILLASRCGVVQHAQPTCRSRTVRDAISRMPRPGRSVPADELHDFPERRSRRIQDMIALIPRNGGSRAALGDGAQLACHQVEGVGFKDVYGRMRWDRVAPTITGGCINPSKGRFLHPHQNRAITLREAALLQTFPRSYYFSLRRGKMNAAVMIGNALPPEFIRRHALMIRRHILLTNLVTAIQAVAH